MLFLALNSPLYFDELPFLTDIRLIDIQMAMPA